MTSCTIQWEDKRGREFNRHKIKGLDEAIRLAEDLRRNGMRKVRVKTINLETNEVVGGFTFND